MPRSRYESQRSYSVDTVIGGNEGHPRLSGTGIGTTEITTAPGTMVLTDIAQEGIVRVVCVIFYFLIFFFFFFFFGGGPY